MTTALCAPGEPDGHPSTEQVIAEALGTMTDAEGTPYRDLWNGIFEKEEQ